MSARIPLNLIKRFLYVLDADGKDISSYDDLLVEVPSTILDRMIQDTRTALHNYASDVSTFIVEQHIEAQLAKPRPFQGGTGYEQGDVLGELMAIRKMENL